MSILSRMLSPSQKRCVEAQRLRHGLHASHPAYVFENHGLDIGEVSLWRDDIGHIRGALDQFAPDADLPRRCTREDLHRPSDHGLSQHHL